MHDSFRARRPSDRREVLLMVNRARAAAPLVALIVSALAGCGSPTQPVVPTPAPAPTPPPPPTPTPCTQGLCEPPVENTAPAARVSIRLYTLEDGSGTFV